jgi:hypothetical protein
MTAGIDRIHCHVVAHSDLIHLFADLQNFAGELVADHNWNRSSSARVGCLRYEQGAMEVFVEIGVAKPCVLYFETDLVGADLEWLCDILIAHVLPAVIDNRLHYALLSLEFRV